MPETPSPATETTPALLAGARQVCAALRRALDSAQLYGEGHAARRPFQDAFARQLSEHTARFGPLRLALSAQGLLVGGETVLVADGRDDPMVRTPFVDHVRALTFLPGATPAELAEFVDAWAASLLPGADEEHTFVTRCWEADFLNVRIETESSVLTDVDELAAAEAFWLAFAAQPAAVPAARTPAILAWHGAETGLPLATLLTTRIPVQLPATVDTRALVAEFVEAGRLSGARALRALAGIASTSDRADEPRVRRMLAGLLELLARTGRFAELLAGARESAASADPESARAMGRALAHPPVLQQVLTGFRDAASAEAAAALVRFLAPENAAQILDAHAAMTDLPARRRLALAIAELRPPAEELVRRLETAPGDVAEELLVVARGLSLADGVRVRVQALGHGDPAVRRAALAELRTEDLAAASGRMTALLADPDEEVRRVILNLVMRARDPAGIAAACERMRQGKAEPAELRRLIVALGNCGGAEPTMLLRQQLRAAKDPGIRGAAALALGQVGDELSRPLLSETASRRGTPPGLREACEQALQRLDARLAKGTP